jgi:hypothetical protein
MQNSLQDQWTERLRAGPFPSRPSFTTLGLSAGAGTLLVPIAKFGSGVGLDPRVHDRLVVLLAVAAKGHVHPDVGLQVGQALFEWQSGDKALAAIRLAFVPLPSCNEDDAHRLFLAEKVLDAGLRPDELLTELGYTERLGPLLKYPGQPRRPRGVPTGGEFAGGASGPASAKPAVVPVFLDTQKQRDLEAKTRPFFAPEPYSRAISDGHALDFIAPGGGAPFPMPGLAPKASEDERNREGPSCPPEALDRSNGSNPAAEAWEHSVHALVNPSDPTQDGNAYYLPNPFYKTGSRLSALCPLMTVRRPTNCPEFRV